MTEMFVYKQGEDTFYVEKPRLSLLNPVTNESLDAIVAGLRPSQKDKILAICGSGDQAFALLEYADSVHTVDKKYDQVEYAVYQSMLLRKNKLSQFLNDIHKNSLNAEFQLRKQYFSQKGRLQKIARKLDSLTFEVADIIEAVEHSVFNKIYLSNIMGGGIFSINYDNFKKLLNALKSKLPKRGLVYVTGMIPGSKFEDFRKKRILQEGPQMQILEKDNELTSIAAKWQDKYEEKLVKIEGHGYLWKPAVYRRK